LRRAAQFGYGAGMTSGQDDRKARLAQALRDNLRRRKAQARESVNDPAPADPKPRQDD
jgi:hypothetical protein